MESRWRTVARPPRTRRFGSLFAAVAGEGRDADQAGQRLVLDLARFGKVGEQGGGQHRTDAL
jgi:hypothetical protein